MRSTSTVSLVKSRKEDAGLPLFGLTAARAQEEHHSVDRADDKRHVERERGRTLPEQATDDARRYDEQIADAVVHAYRTGALVIRGQVDNKGLARWFAELLESSDDECREQCGIACREAHRQWEGRKEHEGQRDE